MEEGGPHAELELRVDNIKAFLNIIQLIKWANKQVGVVRVDASGLSIIATDDSKCLQGKVEIKRQFFKSYVYHGADGARSHLFGVSLVDLIDCISVFATSDGLAELVVKWSDSDASLIFELIFSSDDEHRPIQTCMFAQLACEETERPTDYETHLVEPSTCFIVWTHILKEVSDELEWPGASVQLTVAKQPDRVSFHSEGLEIGSLKIDLDMAHDKYSGQLLKCAEAEVSYRYKYKHLKIATNIGGATLQPQQAAGHASTKVLVDKHGLMKVHHLIMTGGSQHDAEMEARPSATAGACFYLSPEEALDDEEHREFNMEEA
mmetsp:Transcript_7077/g.14282  ORF Transcript_7077/g.14282 Transcript_7077/m.14282 type:complete len:320 (-) Transcript_7077:278-1237(-)|eukprot:CAMPEP_0118954774 /NCGR_PEP_ID=MMETSP1169-20130426/58856_1 /TAXON_ID=36882 /ORGANISM="Pyramimonas obovata, Strain CCMP722" /LENGTH=319 /DNA_ID=CAMNT_0006902463 /DNA_START=252 /DNA_END=1211 /DNA_ORIENTATION=-